MSEILECIPCPVFSMVENNRVELCMYRTVYTSECHREKGSRAFKWKCCMNNSVTAWYHRYHTFVQHVDISVCHSHSPMRMFIVSVTQSNASSKIQNICRSSISHRYTHALYKRLWLDCSKWICSHEMNWKLISTLLSSCCRCCYCIPRKYRTPLFGFNGFCFCFFQHQYYVKFSSDQLIFGCELINFNRLFHAWINSNIYIRIQNTILLASNNELNMLIELQIELISFSEFTV